MHLNISSVKWRPFCPGGDELMLPRAFILNILLCSLLERDSVWHRRQWPGRALLRTLVRILWVPHLVMGLSLSLSLSLSIYSEYLTLLLVRARQCLAPQAMARTGSATHTRPNTVGSPSCDGSESEFESESEPESESGRPSWEYVLLLPMAHSTPSANRKEHLEYTGGVIFGIWVILHGLKQPMFHWKIRQNFLTHIGF